MFLLAFILSITKHTEYHTNKNKLKFIYEKLLFFLTSSFGYSKNMY